MQRILIYSPYINVDSYSALLFVAFCVGLYGLRARLRMLGYKTLPGVLFLLTTFTFSAMGAHLYWLVLKRGPEHAWRAVFFLEPGQVFYGGFIAALWWAVLYAWLRRIHPLDLLDAGAAPLALCYAIGRLGCLANGCCWGKQSAVPWAIQYPPMGFGA